MSSSQAPSKKTSASSTAGPDAREQEIAQFLNNLWFFLFYFALLLMIASFGLIAEA
jgi:hypothetical protein